MASSSMGRGNDRDQLVWEMLLAGWDREEIGRRIGYASPGRVSTVVDAALRRRGLPENIDHRRALQLARLDHLQTRWWDAALEGDLGAAALVQRIIEHRSALLAMPFLELGEDQAAES